jgi:hypothetical protein
LLRRRYSQIIGWSALRFGLEPLAHKLLSHEQQAAANCLAIHHAASEITGNQIVVDASKVPFHFLHLYLETKELIHPVFLVRDARAVVWSKMKRTGISAAKAAKQWLNVYRMMVALLKIIPNSACSFVHYEELCIQPEKVLERILQTANVPVTSLDLGSLPVARHDLAGSPRFRGTSPSTVELDERWRVEMPKKVLRIFEKNVAPVNRKLGYG